MIQITIDNIYDATLPVSVYISDIYGNNKIFLGLIENSVPPSVDFYVNSPSPFDDAPIITLTLEDNNSCVISTTNLC